MDILRAFDLDFPFLSSRKRTPERKSRVYRIVFQLVLQLEPIDRIVRQYTVIANIKTVIVFRHSPCLLLAG